MYIKNEVHYMACSRCLIMAIYRDLNTVKQRLVQFVKTSDPKKDRIAIIGAGHYPLVGAGSPGARTFYPATEPIQKGSFGYYTGVSADFGANLVLIGKLSGIEVRWALMVDDHSQVGEPAWYNFKHAKNAHPLLVEIMNGVRNAHETFRLPSFITGRFITRDDMIFSEKSQDHVFWESDYRGQDGKIDWNARRGCAYEVNLILQELAEKGYNKVIAFFPTRCQGPVCHAVAAFNEVRKRNGGSMRQERIIVTLDTEKGINEKNIMEITRVIGSIRDSTEHALICLNRPYVREMDNPSSFQYVLEKKALENRTVENGGGIFVHRE
jgi:hypothetical protein